jgi:hypothetical protein
VVVAAPHGTSDAGTLATAMEIRAKLGTSGVFVTGFWDRTTRRRINVNRDSEQIVTLTSEVTWHAYTPRAAYINAQYTDLVREVAQGPLRWFFEIHSNHRPDSQDALVVSTLGVALEEVRRFKEGFLSRCTQLPTETRFGMKIAPLDRVWLNYRAASSISRLSERGFAIEHPARLMSESRWRQRYADILAEVIASLIG